MKLVLFISMLLAVVATAEVDNDRYLRMAQRKLCDDYCPCKVPPCLCTDIDAIDLVLLVDASESFKSVRGIIKDYAVTLVDDLQLMGKNLRIGVACFADYATENHGQAGDEPFLKKLPLIKATEGNQGQIVSAIQSIPDWSGGDTAESQLEALYQVATQIMEVGSMAYKVILLMTDSDFHQESGYPGAPWEDTVKLLNEMGIKVVGLVDSLNSLPNDVRNMVQATGTLVPPDATITCDGLSGTYTIPVDDPIICEASGEKDLPEIILGMLTGLADCQLEKEWYKKCDDSLIDSGVVPDIAYIENSMYLDYIEPVLDGQHETNIYIPFTFNEDELNTLKTISFQYIITETIDGNCDASARILKKSEKAHLSSVHGEDLDLDAFQAQIKINDPQYQGASSSTTRILEIFTDISKFGPPFYKEGVGCPANKKCGIMNFCVELQALICGRKVDLVDLNVEIKFDLTVNCAGTNCGTVVLTRNDPTNVNGSTEIGKIRCKPCDAKTGGSIAVGQGASVDACIDMLTDGACITNVNNLDLLIKIGEEEDLITYKQYCIIHETTENSKCLLRLAGPTYDENDAEVTFIPPGEEIQELDPGDENGAIAHFAGDVNIALGYCCLPEDQRPDGTTCNNLPMNRLKRGLIENGIAKVRFEGEEFGYVLSEKTGPAQPKCSENFLLKLLQIFLGWLWSLLGKGPFCV